MTKTTKTLFGTVLTAAFMLLSSISAFAGTTTITQSSNISLDNSYANIIIAQRDSSIKAATKGDVTITDIDTKRISHSAVDTGVFQDRLNIDADAKGDIDIFTLDDFEFDNSYADILIKDKTANFRTRSR